MREKRDALRTSLLFVAGALCGAGIAALYDGGRGAERRKWLQRKLSRSTRMNEQIPTDIELASLVREHLRDICDAENLAIEVNDGHVTVWRGLSNSEATRIAARLSEIPLVTSFYVQPDDTRYLREFQDEDGVAGREQAHDKNFFAA